MKRSLTIILAVLLVIMSFTACTPKEELWINVPEETLQAELGSYDLPKYDVVDANNLIKAGYEVVVKSVVGPDDSEVKVDFADRTAPTMDMREDALPKYYILGQQYQLPVYTLVGDPDYDASFIKVYYMAVPDGEKTEVTVTDGLFTVEHTGIYQILIHAEDAAGNAEEYTFNVEATGPSKVVEGKILYSDEAFGVSQLSFLWNVWEMSYSTEKAYGEEAGSIKVTAPNGGTDYLILSKLIQRDVTAYDEMVLRVYNANDYPVYTGYAWFGDTVLEPNAWTEIVWSLKDVDEKGSHPSVAALRPSSRNLENFSLRFWDDFATNTVTAGSEFYISAMYVREQEVTGPSQVKDDVIMYFDEAWGALQGGFDRAVSYKQEFVTDVKFREEAGSLKITIQRAGDANCYILQNPSILDVSKYDFVEFYVYNPTQTTVGVQLLGCETVNCAAGEWTKVSFPVPQIAESATDVNGIKISATDITNLAIRLHTANLALGDSIYFSQMKGIDDPNIDPIPDATEPKGELVEDLVTRLDGELRIYNDGAVTEYVTDVKYGDQEGSLKVTANTAGEIYITIQNPDLQNVASYEYLSFRVFNPTDREVLVGICWWCDTVCAPGEWTEIQVPVAVFAASKIDDLYSGADILASNIVGLTLRVLGGQNVGESLYFSNIVAVKYDDVVPAGGVADLGTMTSPEGKEGNYLNRGTEGGWAVMNGRSDEEATFNHTYDMVTINGKLSAIGKVMSPYISSTISKLSFGCGYAYTENGIISLTINIKVDGKVVATTQLYEENVEKCANMEFVWNLETPVEGRFMIEIVNNCPTQSTSNKDRIGIWNIAWE